MAETTSHATSIAERYQPYPEYRDSGVEWLGKIPREWSEGPLYARLSRNQSGVWGEDPGDDATIVLRSTDQTKDGQWRFVEPARRSLSAKEAASALLRLDDLVVTKSSGSAQHIGKTTLVDQAIAEERCCFSNFMQRLRLSESANPKYHWYFMNSAVAREQLTYLSSTTTGLGNLNATMLGALRTPTPALPEQKVIATFLDRETRMIDKLVKTNEHLVGLLKEKRSALIAQAVTRGLDHAAPTTDSKIGWLGVIPAHWKTRRIKHVATLVSGHTPDKKIPAYWDDGDIPWVSLADTGQLRQVDYIETTDSMTTAEGIAHSSAVALPPGTVVFSRDATIGLCAITKVEMAVSQHFIGWICHTNILPEYLLFALRSMTQELEKISEGATIRTIGMPDVKSLAIPLPPLTEQHAIVQQIRDRRSNLDALIAKVREAIKLLSEYRSALITAAVTGAIDVRGEAA